MISALAVLAGLSLLLAVWQWVAAWRFPLHRRVADRSFAPAVTLLKPLKGWDERTAECLRSWLGQEYPAEVQVLMGVGSPEDAAVGPVREMLKAVGTTSTSSPSAAGLVDRVPSPRLSPPSDGGEVATDAELLICQESLGVNAKVSTLIQLLRRAKHDIIVVSDADVLVTPDYLVNAVAPLRDSKNGLVNSFYRLADPSTLAMQCEAVAINADFWSQVLQGQTMAPLDFALGAVMTTRREQLVAIGGFEALADFLADDFQLGNRIARAGKRVAICPVAVDCLSSPMGWREVWDHQLRWSRTIRVCKPLPYAFSILNNATFWPLLWLAATQSASTAIVVGALVLARMLMAGSLQQRLAPGTGAWKYCWLAPVKDLMHFGLWALAFCGNRIEWRGQRYRLLKDGKLARI